MSDKVTSEVGSDGNATVTLDQRQNGFLRRGFAVSAVLGLAADISLIGLDNLVLPAKWA